MKKEAVEKTKMRRLAKSLKLELWGAVGILESLWLWTRKNAIQGDIGRFTDDEIAEGIEWNKRKPSELIEALVTHGWIDRAPLPFRLVIHDLQDHADNTWRQALADSGKTFWNGASPRNSTPGRPRKSFGNTRKTPEEFQEEEIYTPDVLDKNSTHPEPSQSLARAKRAASQQTLPPAAELVSWLQTQLHEFRPDWNPPDLKITAEVLSAANGATPNDLIEFLRGLDRQGRKPEKSWAWFVPLVHDNFRRRAS